MASSGGPLSARAGAPHAGEGPWRGRYSERGLAMSLLLFLVLLAGSLAAEQQPPSTVTAPTSGEQGLPAASPPSSPRTPALEAPFSILGADWPSVVQAASAVATVVLTLVILRVYKGQLTAMREQSQHMKEGLEETRRASDAAKSSADAARASIVMTHRPKVIVRNVISPEASRLFEAGAPTSEDFANAFYARLDEVKEVTGTFQIINKGSSPVAKVRVINATMFIGAVLPPKNPCGGHNVVAGLGAVPPGHQAQDIPLTSVALDASQMLSVRQEKTFIFAIGKVLYEDELGGVRRTGFTRRFSMQTGRFVMVKDDPDYEYVD